jgi:DNA helicase-2/ATP-dependent DNA helicase PcrA
MDHIFSNLNDRQIEAARALEGPVLIIAGAGSGKTRTLTHRIAYLIASGVSPHQILAVTFTNKAADEMKRRIAAMIKITSKENLGFGDWSLGFPATKLPVMGTFHSVCARILRRDIEHIGRDRNFVIYDQEDQEKLIKQILKDMHIEPRELKPRTVLTHVGRLKSEVLSPEETAQQAHGDFMKLISNIYMTYQKLLRNHGALDFDDLLLETIRLFMEAPDVLKRYQRTWRYLNVDEYQDTNHAQYLVISKLAEAHRNICVIGDPDQSIYAFRGADIRNILEFQDEYGDARIFTLERNYRSTQPILSVADAIIAPNPKRPPKKMWTDRAGGSPATAHEVRDEQEEASTLLLEVQRLAKENAPLRDQVVLYRTHAQSRVLEEACMKSGIPYRLLGGVKFYARREVKDVLAYLMTIHNPRDSISLLRIINVPSRKIGSSTLEQLQEFCRTQKCSLWEGLIKCGKTQIQKYENIQRFASLIQKYQKRREQVPVRVLTEELLKDIDMEHWLRDDTTEGEERWENVQELLSVMRKYDRLAPLQSFHSFLEEAALVSEVDSLIDASDNALTLMTMHLAKGLEFSAVHIVGCEDGLIPHVNAIFDQDQMEEERRLLYVAMTRAKDHLHLYFAQKRMLFGEFMTNDMSRFLLDIPDSLIDRKSFSIFSPYIWPDSPRHSEETPSVPFEARLTPRTSERREGTVSKSRLRTLHPHGSVEMEFDQDFSLAEKDQEPAPILRKGVRIAHPTFGEGTITAKHGDVLEITFDRSGRKRLALSIAPIRIIE